MKYSRAEQDLMRRKNRKAGFYTFLICGSILVLLFLISWNLPSTSVPAEEGLEVNLGNSDQGLGNDQPFQPNDPSDRTRKNIHLRKQSRPLKKPLKDVETDDKDPDPAPAVKQPPVSKPDATKIPDKDLAVKTPRKTVQPAVNPYTCTTKTQSSF